MAKTPKLSLTDQWIKKARECGNAGVPLSVTAAELRVLVTLHSEAYGFAYWDENTQTFASVKVEVRREV